MEKLRRLHPALQPFRTEIAATLKPVIRITASPCHTTVWQSKFGGLPYWPASVPYPAHPRTGKPLYHLGQINFEETPAIEPFPAQGILQFYLNDESIFDEEYAVIYHQHPMENEPALWKGFEEYPFTGRWGAVDYSLSFETDSEPVSDEDFRFEQYYSKKLQDLISYPVPQYEDEYEVRAFYLSLHRDKNKRKNKMGGYHYSQNGIDPRPMSYMEGQDSLLLMQFDGCDVFSWGDLGSACFFITRQDLEDRDFSNVLYHWDCT